MVSAVTENVCDPAEVRREAVAWVALILSKKATAGDFEALSRWKGLSPSHAAAYAAAIKLHQLVKNRPKYEDDKYIPSVFERTATRRAALAGGAMALGGYGVVRPPLGLWPSLSELSSDYRTVPGEQHSVQIARNVLVDMNTRTSLSRRDTPSLPGIELVTGEIVVASLANEFATYAGQGQVVASRASFNLRKDGDIASITCIAGQIEITHLGRRIVIGPAQRITYTNSVLNSPVQIDPELVTAWQRGLLIFHDVPLKDVVSEVNRYRSGRIVIIDHALANYRLNGEFRIANIQSVVAQIQSVTNATITNVPGGIVLLA
jgi:transmembrane sensor